MATKFDDMFLVDNFETWVNDKNTAIAIQFETQSGLKSKTFYLSWSCVGDMIKAFVEARLEAEAHVRR